MIRNKAPPRTFGNQASRINYSVALFHVTINSNQYGVYGDDVYKEWYQKIENALYDDILTPDSTQPTEAFIEIFGPPYIVAGVDLESFTGEVGTKRHKIHFHFLFRIKYYTPTYDPQKFKKRLKDWLDTNVPLPELRYIKKKEYDQGIRERKGKWAVYVTSSPGETNAIDYDNKVGRFPKMVQTMRDHGDEAADYVVDYHPKPNPKKPNLRTDQSLTTTILETAMKNISIV